VRSQIDGSTESNWSMAGPTRPRQIRYVHNLCTLTTACLSPPPTTPPGELDIE
jgi:hypothetical protein